MKTLITAFLLLLSFQFSNETLDKPFFPKFVAYSQDPILDWNDSGVGSWADPCVLKVDNQYIMYVSGMKGGIATPLPISIYRFTSTDGYDWEMNPKTPVFSPKAGTFYEGSIETPNVVYYKGEYHMYNTVYLENIPALFKVSHATSPDGITWTMDSTPILVPDPAVDWMSEIVAEPGALVKNDTLHLFYTAISDIGLVSIGLTRSVDGKTFIDTTQAVTIPRDIYPFNEGYLGLSTPDATLVGDTIYLFTDLVQKDTHNDWNQVGLHQFKSYGDITKWDYDTSEIHKAEEFTWSDGNYTSQLLGVTPLMDGNRLRIWYWGYDIAQINPPDTTYHVNLVGKDLHPKRGHWGIGTSEFKFKNLPDDFDLSVDDIIAGDESNSNIKIAFSQNKGTIKTNNTLPSEVSIYAINGQLLYYNTFKHSHDFTLNYDGVILIKVSNDGDVITKKLVSIN